MTQQQRNLRNVLVVLAAVLVVGSFAVPAFTGYVERSRVARAVSDIGTVSLRLHQWQRSGRSLPQTLAEAGITAVDPWGRPYVYLRAADARRAQLRKDGELVPLNSDFDLYSLGPDGISALALPAAPSQDDVVRAANGAFIGVAASY
ncbi:MAG TPA: prepilin-type cleavage/methylation domain-containing protein [Gammaproteobacteria bacterium]|nr:prepilin-type cleavage/methylation domain-containing protein [Gammaproteobacteria bacterium]